MTWKQVVNSALRQATGYQLVRAEPRGKSGDGRPAARRGDAGSATPRSGGRAGAKPAAERKLPADYDDEAKEIIEAVRPYTMTASDKLYALILATRYVEEHRIPGDIVECGVWRGGSMQAVARTLLALGDPSRDLFLFDTFEGMPPPSDRDVRHDGRSASELLGRLPQESTTWAVATLEEVKEAFAGIRYPAEKLHFVKGRVEDTVPAQAPAEISILRLDTDWYESTRHELEHLYPRLVSGGVLLIDDYGWWEGSREATEEFLRATGERLLLLRMASGRVAVKP